MFWDVRSTSTSTGVAPTWRMALIVATNVSGVVMTSSPGWIPNAIRPRCSAAEQELTATACLQPTYSATSCSKRATFGPVPTQPD